MSGKQQRRLSECTARIKKHLDCIICAHIYSCNNPAKALPCLHIYCLRCLNRMIKRNCIECPECRQIHVVPTNGTEGFTTNYVVMRLINEVEQFDSDTEKSSEIESSSNSDRTAEQALCDIAINSLEKLHNEARDIRCQVGNQYEKAIERVKESSGAYKDAVTYTIEYAQERLREIQQLAHNELERKTATEIQSIESQQAQWSDVVNNVEEYCEMRVQDLQRSGGLNGGEWGHLVEELEDHEERLTGICNTQMKVTYNVFTMPPSDTCAAIDGFEKLKVINEEEAEINVDVQKGNGVATLPNPTGSSGVRKLVRQSGFNSEREVPRGQTESSERQGSRRNRHNEKEHVVIHAFSEDTTSLLRVCIASHVAAVKSSEISSKPAINPGKISTTEFSTSYTPPLPGKKPPLPARKPRQQEPHQGPQPIFENQETVTKVHVTRMRKQDSVAKVVTRVVPCRIIESDDSNPLQPLGVVAMDAGRFAVASGDGFKIFENGQDVTPRRNVRPRSPQIFTDVCCLLDGTLLATVEGTKDIFKYNRSGMPIGIWEIVDMGTRLKNPIRPFGIVCDIVGNVYISDRGNRCILVCNQNGRLRHLIGCKGSPDTQLQDPLYLALNQPTESLLYVADSTKGAIITYMVDGTFIRELSWKADSVERRALSGPVGIAPTRDGQLVVTDRKTNTAMVMDPVSGMLLREFGSKGSNGGEFDTPMGVAFIDGKLAVCDSNNYRIQLFDWPLP